MAMTTPFVARQIAPSLVNRRTKAANQPSLHARRYGHFAFRSLAAAILVAGSMTAGEAQARSMESYQPLILEAAHRFAIPSHWISAVIAAESAANPQAVSRKGAMGLMQIMPDTWDQLRTEHDLGSDSFAPADNILAGTAYLRQMLDRYGSVALMLAAYNAGPGRVDEFLATGRVLPEETVDYVARLLPELSSVHHHSAPATPTNESRDPSAASIFVPAGGGFYSNLERPAVQTSPSVPPTQLRQPAPSTHNGAPSEHRLFVPPNTQRRR